MNESEMKKKEVEAHKISLGLLDRLPAFSISVYGAVTVFHICACTMWEKAE